MQTMIDFETRGGTAVISLRNGRLNILTREMHEQLYRHLLRFRRDDSLKVAVLTSQAGTSFSAGDDLKTINDDFGEEPDWEELVMTMPRTKPVVAAVRGHCVGQGLVYLLMLTDVRFATRDARFGFPEIRYGYGGAAALTRLAQQIPPTVAMRLALTGDPMSGEQAAACGLVNEVVDDEQLLEVALAEAEAMATHPQSGLRAEMIAAARGGLSRSESLALFSHLWDSFPQNP